VGGEGMPTGDPPLPFGRSSLARRVVPPKTRLVLLQLEPFGVENNTFNRSPLVKVYADVVKDQVSGLGVLVFAPIEAVVVKTGPDRLRPRPAVIVQVLPPPFVAQA